MRMINLVQSDGDCCKNLFSNKRLNPTIPIPQTNGETAGHVQCTACLYALHLKALYASLHCCIVVLSSYCSW